MQKQKAEQPIVIKNEKEEIEIFLKELLKINEKDILINEESLLLDHIEKLQMKPFKKMILGNFYRSKYEQNELMMKFLKKMELKYEEKQSFISSQSFSNLLTSQEYIEEKLTCLMVDNEKAEQEKELSNPNNYFCSTADIMTSPQVVVFTFRVFYSEGSEICPQIVKIVMSENNNLEYLIKQIKKTLGIYEFSKFNVLYKKHDFWYPVLTIQDLKKNPSEKIKNRIEYSNDLKLAPI
jgi:hypothetical protein